MNAMRSVITCLAVLLVVAVQASAQSFVIYDNGPLVTHPGQGPGGADASVLDTANGLSTLGFGALVPTVAVADDFVVPHGQTWLVDGFNFFAYQTGAVGVSIMELYIALYDRAPNEPGAQVVWGDLATNAVSGVTLTDIYRVNDFDMTNSDRRIQLITASFDPIPLSGGAYWLVWQLYGELPSGPWVPPVTYPGQDFSGNALQLVNGVWSPIRDDGTLTYKAVPFQVTSPVPEPALMAQMLCGG